MKKKIFNIIAILALVASFALPALVAQNVWADVSCDGVSSSAAKSKCESQASNCSKIPDTSARQSCEAQVQKRVSNCINVPDTRSKEQCFNAQFGTSSSSTTDNQESTNTTDTGGGGTSPSSGSSKATSGATESSPELLYENRQCPEGEVYTSIIGGGGCVSIEDNGGNIFSILNTVLTILTYGVGIAGTLGIVISGIQYLTARDNEQQMVKAKSRLINIVIGLAAYAFMWAFLQWLIPGGLLSGSK